MPATTKLPVEACVWCSNVSSVRVTTREPEASVARAAIASNSGKQDTEDTIKGETGSLLCPTPAPCVWRALAPPPLPRHRAVSCSGNCGTGRSRMGAAQLTACLLAGAGGLLAGCLGCAPQDDEVAAQRKRSGQHWYLLALIAANQCMLDSNTNLLYFFLAQVTVAGEWVIFV